MPAKIQPTLLKKMHIKNFRNLQDVEIEFGTRITVISGKNGTAKSTILGLVAQIFSFDKDYTTNIDLKNYQTLNEKKFKSEFKDHFRLSRQYDRPGEMDVLYCVYDAYLKQNIENLTLRLTNTRGRSHRAVVRNNIRTKYSNNTSRNVTHPVIYLNLKRLYPIAERKETISSIKYLIDNSQEFIRACNQILTKTNRNITSTQGRIINSSVAHGDNYDHESVSSGEDNVGQIVQALFSFKRLKEEYKDYHGGLLIIDEIDAGLFPSAQEKIMEQIQNFANDYNIQVIVTSHSPIIIENIFKKSQKHPNYFKSIFLTNDYGSLQVKNDYDWADIYADLFNDIVDISDDIKLPLINVYGEDKEAFDFLNKLISSDNIKKVVHLLDDISMGCTSYHNLVKKNILEFTKKSIIVLDGDESHKDLSHNMIALPSNQPPDRLVFKFLYYLDQSDVFWQNKYRFTQQVFLGCDGVLEIIDRLSLEASNIDDFDAIVQQELDNKDTKGIRKLFKRFYQDEKVQKILADNETCPFVYILEQNPNYQADFEHKFINGLKYVFEHGFGVPTSKIESYFNGQT